MILCLVPCELWRHRRSGQTKRGEGSGDDLARFTIYVVTIVRRGAVDLGIQSLGQIDLTFRTNKWAVS